MKIQRLRRQTDEAAVTEAASVLKGGGVVLFPSDTCYGLAVDALEPNALDRLYAMKMRPREKAVSCIFASIDAIAEYALVEREAREILERNLPGPFTFLLPARPDSPLPFLLIGARIPDCPLTQTLAHALGAPYTATSANISGRESCYDVKEFLHQYALAGLRDLPDLALDAGDLPRIPPSTVIDLSRGKPRTVRSGTHMPIW